MYAFAAVTTESEDQEIVAARQGPPLVIGLCEGEQFLASDPSALLVHTKDVIFLENGDLALLKRSGIEIWDRQGNRVERPVQRLNWDPIQAEKGGYKHFMLKEIHEQTQAVQDTFAGRVDFENARILFDTIQMSEDELRSVERIHMLACGTSWHAGLIGKFLIEELARVPVEVDYGSEYRYRKPIVTGKSLAVGISQSGETADTLSAMEAARDAGAHLFTVCNVQGSQATRISEGVIYTHAGPEIGVASTKAFTTQLATLACLAIGAAAARGQLSPAREAELGQALDEIPARLLQVLALDETFAEIAKDLAGARDALFIGRGPMFPIALEGALKLKEISYIHAEGYAAGELKHGPIALVDEYMPVIVLAPSDAYFAKTASNLEEVAARGGRILLLSDTAGIAELGAHVWRSVELPTVDPVVAPILYSLPVQLLAYHTAVLKGTDVDQPRNLAKSVTVE
jgi:glucosamine--fructose-6-phosphate aminotransferase (isomerizing)